MIGRASIAKTQCGGIVRKSERDAQTVELLSQQLLLLTHTLPTSLRCNAGGKGTTGQCSTAHDYARLLLRVHLLLCASCLLVSFRRLMLSHYSRNVSKSAVCARVREQASLTLRVVSSPCSDSVEGGALARHTIARGRKISGVLGAGQKPCAADDGKGVHAARTATWLETIRTE